MIIFSNNLISYSIINCSKNKLHIILITMNKILFSFLITFLAGASTILGIIPCYMKESKKDKIIAYSLSFSAGVMITISISSLIPESIALFSTIFNFLPLLLVCAIFVVIGILFSSKIDEKIEEKFTSNKLYKLGIISVIVLMLHNIPEGITTFISTSTNLKLGLSLSLAIALHNIPEGISIAVPIYYATNSKKEALLKTFLSGIAEPIGALIAYIFLSKYITDSLISIILILLGGIMITLAIEVILPKTKKYNLKGWLYLGFMIGIGLMLFNYFVF